MIMPYPESLPVLRSVEADPDGYAYEWSLYQPRFFKIGKTVLDEPAILLGEDAQQALKTGISAYRNSVRYSRRAERWSKLLEDLPQELTWAQGTFAMRKGNLEVPLDEDRIRKQLNALGLVALNGPESMERKILGCALHQAAIQMDNRSANRMINAMSASKEIDSIAPSMFISGSYSPESLPIRIIERTGEEGYAGYLFFDFVDQNLRTNGTPLYPEFPY